MMYVCCAEMQVWKRCKRLTSVIICEFDMRNDEFDDDLLALAWLIKMTYAVRLINAKTQSTLTVNDKLKCVFLKKPAIPKLPVISLCILQTIEVALALRPCMTFLVRIITPYSSRLMYGKMMLMIRYLAKMLIKCIDWLD